MAPGAARFALMIFIGCLFSLGCGGDLPKQKTYPVTGKITLDGKPVPNVTVVFKPVNPANFKWAELPQGTTDAEGKFTLFTYTNAPADGAPAAEYQVGFEFAAEVEDDGGDQVKRSKGPRIPRKYADPKLSGITVNIEAKTNVLEPFALSSKP